MVRWMDGWVLIKHNFKLLKRSKDNPGNRQRQPQAQPMAVAVVTTAMAVLLDSQPTAFNYNMTTRIATTTKNKNQLTKKTVEKR